jgi:hypothetical protein
MPPYIASAINPQTGYNPPPQTVTANQGMPPNGYNSFLGSLIGAGASLYGSQNAAEAATKGNLAGINTQNATMGNINAVYAPQSNLGTGAFNTLGSTLGLNGAPADYSNFLNMPGYQFAIQQGTQAIDRQATAMGNAYTPNTLTAVGQYVTGTAMQDYNTYVNQLLQAGQFGAQANQGRASAYLGTGANISQLQANTGQNQAGAYTAAGGLLGGPNSSGLINTAAGLIGKGANYLFGGGGGGGGGGTGAPGDTSAYDYSAQTGFTPMGGPGGTDYSPYVSAPSGDNSVGNLPDFSNWAGSGPG